jgi:hypothetical protein
MNWLRKTQDTRNDETGVIQEKPEEKTCMSYEVLELAIAKES